jgi:hypothetical protein
MSFRPNYSAGWRQREVEKARSRKEADQKLADEIRTKSIARTETNFPVLPVAAPVRYIAPPPVPMAAPAGDNSFADMANVWRISDEHERARVQHNQVQAERNRSEFAGLFIPRFQPGRLDNRKNARFDSSSSEEEDPIHRSQNVEDEDWNEVKRKAHKGPHILTEAEISRRCSASSSEDDEGVDHNGHLFESYRHDHH